MDDLLLFLTSKEIMIVYLLILVIAALAIIVWLIEKSYYRRKLRNNTRKLNKLVDEVEEKLSEEKVISSANNNVSTVSAIETVADNSKKVEEVVAPQNEEIEIIDVDQHVETLDNKIETPKVEEPKSEIVYETVEDEEKMAQEEIRKITESLIDGPKNEPIENIALTKFEEEQEKNSIISIDELMASKELYDANMLKEYEDENNVLISLNELEKLKDNNVVDKPVEVVPLTIVEEKDIKPNVVKEKQTTYTFKSTPVISPIYGFEKKEEKMQNNNLISLENSATYDKFDEEIKKTNEFLNTLKELQKKLD